MTQRIPGIDPNEVEPRIGRVLEAQAKKWGGPLINHLVYARVPAIFHAVRGMWGGLDASGKLSATLVALLNRRVAALNHCPFLQDINAAVGSAAGLTTEKILALDDYLESGLYTPAEKVALQYADAITLSDRDVSDELFAEVQSHYSDDEIVELTETIAWENASSKFNRALRISSQNLWQKK